VGCALHNPCTAGSSGSSTKFGQHVIYAEPSTSGTIAANAPTSVSRTMRAILGLAAFGAGPVQVGGALLVRLGPRQNGFA